MTQGYMRTTEAAKYLGIGISTLERWRTSGDGPKFRKLGNRIVVYAVTDMDEWASEATCSSTSQNPAKVVGSPSKAEGDLDLAEVVERLRIRSGAPKIEVGDGLPAEPGARSAQQIAGAMDQIDAWKKQGGRPKLA